MQKEKKKTNFRTKSKKSIALLVSLLLIVGFSVGGALALLFDTSSEVVNEFTPSKITTSVEESLTGNTKSNVSIKNTGNTAAWIRAAVVITWKDAAGNVYGQVPIKGTDYEITWGSDWSRGSWLIGSDGFYYWSVPVEAGQETGVLISTCTAKDTAPSGYFLNVEIIGSGLQSVPATVFSTQWNSSGLELNSVNADPAQWNLTKPQAGGAGS